MKNFKNRAVLSSALTALLFTGLSATGLSTSAHAQVDDEVIVTGSFIKRKSQADLASPLATIGTSDITSIGAQNIADITQTLTVNTGSQNNPDAFTQNATTGTSNINLRGLGLQSTLVLLNGKRNPLNAAQTNTGISFVDTNSLIPLIALDRQEILLDGASALYGSDAVAGVANFITKTDVDGFQASFDFQTHTPSGQSQRDLRFEGLYGKTFDRGSFLIAGSYVDRTPLTTEERRLSVPFGANQDVSSLGNPGAFIVPALIPEIRDLETAIGLPAGGLPNFFIDPTGCAEFGGNPAGSPLPVASGFIPGVCQFDFGDFFNLVADEQRINLYGQVDYDITDNINFSLDGSYTTFDSTRGNSPTFPFLQTAILSPANPDNPFTSTALFFGRAIGNGGTTSLSFNESDTYRISANLSGDFSLGNSGFLDNVGWDISYTRGENDFFNSNEDTVTARFQCALLGAQGTPTPNPATGGATTCENFVGFDGPIPAGQIFNPFATSFTTNPNSPELLDFIIDRQEVQSTSTIDVVDAVFTSDLYQAPAGPIGAAIGFQYRRDEQERDFDDVSNVDQFGFLIGGNDFQGTTDVFAVFGELAVPVNNWIDLQLALRFEGFGGNVGSTVDPKFAILARPTDWLSLRGSYSTSFRAPTTFQQVGESTTLNQTTDPFSPTPAFAAVRAFGSEELSPETSRAFNAGFTTSPVDGFDLSIDYFNFSFEDAITQDSFQALVNANPIDTRTFVGGLPTTACALENTIVCRAGDPNTGTITQVNTTFINAAAIDTAGFDLRASWAADVGALGTLTPSFDATWIINHDIQVVAGGPVINGLGSRNQSNFADPTPELRVNVGLNWAKDNHNFDFFARRIGSLDDDQNPGSEVESQTRFDLRYAYNLGGFVDFFDNAAISVGVINLTDELPPFVATNGGFESRISNPVGRLVNIGFDVGF